MPTDLNIEAANVLTRISETMRSMSDVPNDARQVLVRYGAIMSLTDVRGGEEVTMCTTPGQFTGSEALIHREALIARLLRGETIARPGVINHVLESLIDAPDVVLTDEGIRMSVIDEEDPWNKVIRALSESTYQRRSVTGIASATGLSKEQVRVQLSKIVQHSLTNIVHHGTVTQPRASVEMEGSLDDQPVWKCLRAEDRQQLGLPEAAEFPELSAKTRTPVSYPDVTLTPGNFKFRNNCIIDHHGRMFMMHSMTPDTILRATGNMLPYVACEAWDALIEAHPGVLDSGDLTHDIELAPLSTSDAA